MRIEVLETPAPIKEGGRWCVQIGAFSDARDASHLKEKLARRYRTAKVLQFSSPMGVTGCASAWLKTIKNAPRK